MDYIVFLNYKQMIMRLPLFVLLLIGIGCRQEKKYHDLEEKRPDLVVTGAVEGILEFQQGLNASFKDPETSPLPDRYRKDFEMLDFFEPDTSYIVRAKMVRTPEALPFLMPTTTDRKSTEVVYGIVQFSLDGEMHRLEIYQNKELMLQEGFEDYLFLPFTDPTNGSQTYAGGRYLDLRVPKGDSITIDFNRAYNPYCAYNKKYSCPIVPSVNTLNVPIFAGVKSFKQGKE